MGLTRNDNEWDREVTIIKYFHVYVFPLGCHEATAQFHLNTLCLKHTKTASCTLRYLYKCFTWILASEKMQCLLLQWSEQVAKSSTSVYASFRFNLLNQAQDPMHKQLLIGCRMSGFDNNHIRKYTEMCTKSRRDWGQGNKSIV